MVNIYEILQRAASLKEETALNSISPERAGGIMYDTLLALNDLWLQQGSALVISKIYASVAAMEADTAPVSDLTGKPLRPGQIVVIASSDSDNGSVYRYNGTDAPSWSLVGAIGNLTPVDSLDSESTTLPLAAHQGKVLDGKISQLGQKLIKLVAFVTTQSGLNVGDIYYNTSLKQIRRKTASGYDILPYLDGAIYTYNDELYIWNGNNLEKSFSRFNKYIPQAPARAKETLIELYLYGNVDANETYYIEEYKHISSGVRLYINKLSTHTTIALVEGGQEFQIAEIIPANGSGIKGYIISNTTVDDSYNLAENITFDTKVITNLDESPSIKVYLQEQELSLRINAIKPEIINDASIFNNAFVRILSGNISSEELIMIKSIKNIRLIGDWNASKKYAFRWIYRNSSTDGYRLNMYEIGDNGYEAQGSYNIRIIPIGSVVEGTGATYVEFTVENEPNKKVTAYIDYSLITEPGVATNFHRFVLSPDCFEISESSLQDVINPPSAKAVKSAIENVAFESTIDVAKGNISVIGSSLSEHNASPIVDDIDFVGFETMADNQQNKSTEPGRFIAVIHDDLPASDYIANRKIYNKYGFNCNFSWILMPFSNVSDKQVQTYNIKRLLKDGNELGLHAIFGKSYWRLNKMFDVKPNGGSNFAPNITELQGINADHTGENAFGKTITASTLISSMYSGVPSDYTSTKVVELTSEIVNAINRSYCIYSDDSQFSGLDVNDTLMSNKTILQWLEYWYNTWIDSSLGYSSTESTLINRFAEDYDDVTKYPDAEHIINGKMVHFQDTTNPHYNDEDYQKVGKFTKGLYKGSFSTCNYEVMDMIVKVAEHYVRAYFGCKNLVDTHRHGAYDTSLRWVLNGIRYQDRGYNVIDGANGIIYSTKNGMFTSEIKILKEFGVSELSEEGASSLMRTYEGQIGLFLGQRNIRQTDVSNFHSAVNGTATYLNIFGTNESETMSFSDFYLFTKDIQNQIQYFYKYAGTSQTNNGVTKTVFSTFKNAIKIINSCLGTNKIPVFAWDTIRKNPAISQAVELLCRYCYDNGIGILPLSKANQIATNRDSEIHFPNPSFNQIMLKYFDGEDVIPNDAGIPDGWRLVSGSNDTLFDVSSELVDGTQKRVLTVTPNVGSTTLQTKIYGLKCGKYNLSFYIKGTYNGSATSKIRTYLQKNNDLLDVTAGVPIDTTTPSSSWELVNVPFAINAPYQLLDKSSPISVMCDGFENNVCNITVRLNVANGESVSLCAPSIEKE